MDKEKVRFEIVWTETAKSQFLDILAYWIQKNHSNNYSLKIIDLVEDRLDFISTNPKASTKTDYSATRKCAMGHFSIIYKLTKDKIYITAFWDNRQSPDKLQKILKEK
ncbi:MAG: type II toxin-antitoxin system RelE/ParE family toxin [Vicingaceae bacterium]